MQQIGIVGTGGMGGGVANRLIEQDMGVTLWNRSRGALDEFDGQSGVRLAATPGDAAACGVVISFVANDAALSDVTDGDDGIAAHLPKGGCHISMSSVSPALIAQLADTHAKHGSTLVSAPVFGRPEAAAKGLLWVALSGADAGKTAARTVLEKVSRSIHDFGTDPTAAISAKIAGNFLIASAIESMSEAFAMLEQNGVDAAAFHAMMSDTIFASVIHQNYGKIILDEAFDPPGFKLALGGKDVGLALDLAKAAGVALPFGDILKDRFATSVADGHGERDWNAISMNARQKS